MLNIPTSAAPCARPTLRAHPTSRVEGVESIQVDIACLPGNALRLTYQLSGDLNHIRLPSVAPAARADKLWQHTCFEAFIRTTGSPAYREFNFSPSGHWQAYAFADYRTGGLLEPAAAPQIECLIEPGRLTLQVTIPPDNIPFGRSLQLGLSAVMEHINGSIGYWALQHAAGKPDFHHPDTFALEINLP